MVVILNCEDIGNISGGERIERQNKEQTFSHNQKLFLSIKKARQKSNARQETQPKYSLESMVVCVGSHSHSSWRFPSRDT